MAHPLAIVTPQNASVRASYLHNTRVGLAIVTPQNASVRAPVGGESIANAGFPDISSDGNGYADRQTSLRVTVFPTVEFRPTERVLVRRLKEEV